MEAHGVVPKRNVERMLRDTGVPVAADDTRRLDLVVSGLSSFKGLPFFFCAMRSRAEQMCGLVTTF